MPTRMEVQGFKSLLDLSISFAPYGSCAQR